MSNHESEGPIQVFGNSPQEINDALAQISNRLDHLKGLRGRTLLYDRVRAEDPRARGDVLTSGSLATIAQVVFVTQPAQLYVRKPGISLVEISAGLKRKYNFSGGTVTSARIIFYGWGTETGNKRLQVRNEDTILCTLNWEGTGENLLHSDPEPVTVTTDEDSMRLFCAASSVEECIVIGACIVELTG